MGQAINPPCAVRKYGGGQRTEEGQPRVASSATGNRTHERRNAIADVLRHARGGENGLLQERAAFVGGKAVDHRLRLIAGSMAGADVKRVDCRM